MRKKSSSRYIAFLVVVVLVVAGLGVVASLDLAPAPGQVERVTVPFEALTSAQ